MFDRIAARFDPILERPGMTGLRFLGILSILIFGAFVLSLFTLQYSIESAILTFFMFIGVTIGLWPRYFLYFFTDRLSRSGGMRTAMILFEGFYLAMLALGFADAIFSLGGTWSGLTMMFGSFLFIVHVIALAVVAIILFVRQRNATQWVLDEDDRRIYV